MLVCIIGIDEKLERGYVVLNKLLHRNVETHKHCTVFFGCCCWCFFFVLFFAEQPLFLSVVRSQLGMCLFFKNGNHTTVARQDVLVGVSFDFYTLTHLYGMSTEVKMESGLASRSAR